MFRTVNRDNPVYLLAIDLGTSTCKASVFSPAGEMISRAHAVTPKAGNDPDKWGEIPERWWQTVTGTIREAISRATVSPTSIVGIGVCAFMHTPIGLDSSGDVVTPTMIWFDTRSSHQAETLQHEYGRLFREITGNEPRHNHTAAKIRWLVDNYPDRVVQVRNWLLPKDYLRYRLTGLIGTDVSDAIGTLLYDPIRKCWNETLAEASGTKIDFLPQIYKTLDLVSLLSKAGAEATGLLEGTPVIGCADGYATLIGANGCSGGRVCLYLGTSAWLTRFIQNPDVDPRRKIVPAEDGYHQWLGAIASAGSSLNWAIKLFGNEELEPLLTRAETVPPGSSELFFLPHLVGERGPIYDPNVRGALVGLHLDHDQPEIIRAVLEGVAYQVAAVFDASELRNEIDLLTVVGGGANSRLWIQIIADVLNKSIEVPVVVEAGLLGVAALAGSAIGLLSGPELKAAGMFRRAYIHAPDPDRTIIFSELLRKFKELDTLLTNRYLISGMEKH